MLDKKEINIPFCFCWANENWSRRWDGGNHEIIVEQDYGCENEWERHFQYLLVFFKDSRYILMNNAPLLIIYKPDEIPNINEMVLYFKQRCIDEGFSGCTIIYQDPTFLFGREWLKVWFKRTPNDKLADYVCDYFITFEPRYTFLETLAEMCLSKRLCYAVKDRLKRYIVRKLGIISPQIRDYDEDWHHILARPFNNRNMLAGAFVNWDNTPRNKNGLAYIKASPEKFENYLGRLAIKVQKSDLANIIFLTAWNEWGEGSYLEPDEENGYGYLNAVKHVVEKCSLPC